MEEDWRTWVTFRFTCVDIPAKIRYDMSAPLNDDDDVDDDDSDAELGY